MNATIRSAIESGSYCVDPQAVAEAIMRRARHTPPPPVPLQVLVPPDLFEETAAATDEVDPPALEHDA